MKITTGRIVHFWYTTDANSEGPYPAICVKPDSKNGDLLVVFDPTLSKPVYIVAFEGETHAQAGCWSWPTREP